MSTFRSWLVCFIVIVSMSVAVGREGSFGGNPSNEWLDSTLGEIARREYEPSLQAFDAYGDLLPAPKYHFVNRAQSLRMYVDKSGMEIYPRAVDSNAPWNLRCRLAAIYRQESRVEDLDGVLTRMTGENIVNVHERFTEVFSNSEEGIGYVLTVSKRPAGVAKLSIKYALRAENALCKIDGENITVYNRDDNELLRIHFVNVSDAAGRVLDTPDIFYKNESVIIACDDNGAVYPLNVKMHIVSVAEHPDNQYGNVEPDNQLDGISTSANWTAESNQADALLGWTAVTAGDVNGDGYSDIIVSAMQYDNGQINEGRIWVFHGSASGLSSGSNWLFEPNQAYAQLGYSTGTAGDVNGDGYSDIIAGAVLYDNGELDEGRAYVFHGSAAGLPPSPNWTGESNQDSAQFGVAVAHAGDVNGDGYSDVIVGAAYYNNGETDEGRAFVYYGGASGLSVDHSWSGEADQASAYFGISVAAAGDVNGDGYGDVIVGSTYFDNAQTDEGRAFVYHGSSSGLSSNADWTAESDQQNAYFGISVASAGDVNGDGYSDVIVGAHRYDNGQADEGRAFVYHGSGSGLSAAADWVKETNQAGSCFGISVASAGDPNGDGFADVIVGGYYYDYNFTDEGAAWAYFGSDTGLAIVPDWSGTGAQTDARYGYSVSTAGDVNGDGYSDIIVGAPLYNNGQTNEGRAYVYHGDDSGLQPEASWIRGPGYSSSVYGRDVSTAGDVNGDGFADVIVGDFGVDRVYVYHGSASGLHTTHDWTVSSSWIGSSVACAGDVNNDGYSDVIIGAAMADAQRGRAYAYYGSASGLPLTPNWTGQAVPFHSEASNFGASVATAGDVNGDGYSDVIVGAPNYDSLYMDGGAVFVFNGGPSGLSTTPSWLKLGGAFESRIGWEVSTAGDVNGDGYSDVLVGTTDWHNPEAYEGVVWAYHGSSSGLSTSPSWTKEGNAVARYFGQDFATTGDVNGDGYSDIIVSGTGYSNGQTDEGCIWLYFGHAAGLSPNSDWRWESNQANAYFGTVASAGDVNGDGYSDLIAAAINYDNGQTDEGRALVYFGSSTGLSSYNWYQESDSANAHYGRSISTAGDVNGDGYSDIIIAADNYLAGSGRGRVYSYNGNSEGIALVPRQAYSDGTRLLQLLDGLNATSFRMRLLGKTPAGRGDVKLQWEVKPFGQNLNGTGLSASNNWYNTGTAGVEISEYTLGLLASTGYHWQARLRYSPVTYNGAVHSRWVSIGPNGKQEMDFRNGSTVGVADDGAGQLQRFSLDVCPSIASSGFTVVLGRSAQMVPGDQDMYSINIYDVSGRQIKSLYHSTSGSRRPIVLRWQGRDDTGRDLSAGVYFIKLMTENYTETKRVVLLRQ